jgi:ABC-2 type transport system ATP-binding protein
MNGTHAGESTSTHFTHSSPRAAEPESTHSSGTTNRPLALELTGLAKSFGSVHAVKDVDLTVRQGEIVAFLGPNGAGKTTTIDMILGLAQPSAGQVKVFGLEPGQAVAHGLVSAVMQTGGLLKDLTVRETIDYTAALFPSARPVDEIIQRAGLADIADRRVDKCSGGEQQRVRFGMALVPDPELIILDEPTAGMDVNARRAFWDAIRQDAEQGRTVLFATHYLEEADAYADRIVLIRSGEIVADGTAAQLKAQQAGRRLQATWPGAASSEATRTLATLRALPGVQDVEVRGEQVIVHALDSDTVARHLLTQTPARDLEITTRGLEDAFVALTTDPIHDASVPADRKAQP